MPKTSVTTIRPTVAPKQTDDDAVQEKDSELDWFADEQYDGQLAIDVYQTPDAIVIKSAIAGVEPDDLAIAVHHDVVTIRGRRKQHETVKRDDYLFQECYWGSFSRSIILPMEVDAEKTSASLKSGILMVRLPKAKHAGAHQVRVRSDDDT